MSIDILYILSNKDKYYKYSSYLKEHTLSKESFIILKDLDLYFSQHPSILDVDWDSFATWFRVVMHPMFNDDKQQLYQEMFNTLKSKTSLNSDTEESLLQTFIERDFATQIANLSLKTAEGETKGNLSDIQQLLDEFHKETGKLAHIDAYEVQDTLSDILAKVTGTGLDWRLKCLNRSVGPLRKGDFIIIGARPDSGKCFAKGTPILMYDGSVKPVESVTNGELVMGPDSNPRVVGGTTSGVENLYRIQYKNGEYYDVNESHILSLKRSKEEGQHKVGDILNVSVKEYLTWPKGRKQRYKGWKSGVDFPYTPFASKYGVSPYAIGVWLGDGNSSGPQFTNADEKIWEALAKEANHITKSTGLHYYLQYQAGDNTGTAVVCRLTHGIKGKPNRFKETLKKLNLLHNKHIPKELLHNDRNVRLNVLAGLLDTDGSVSNGCGYEITQKRKQLAEDILFLARSLGYRATLRTKIVNEQEYYRVGIVGDFTELNKYIQVDYKRVLPHSKPKRKGLHFGFDIIPLGKGEYYGFTVDKDSLFLLGDFTVVHNTTLLASEVTHMAQQLAADEVVLWFNNEEQGWKVKYRIIQAAIGWEGKDISNNEQQAWDEYIKLLGDKKIVIIDKADLHVKDINHYLKKHNAGLIVFDQLWKVHGFDKKGTNDVTNQTLLANQAREWAKTWAPIINVHQADGTAEGVQYITQNQLYGSKTGIQGEADAIITLGRSHSPGLEKSRFIFVPKNKMMGGPLSIPAEKNGKYEIEFLTDKARFKEA